MLAREWAEWTVRKILRDLRMGSSLLHRRKVATAPKSRMATDQGIQAGILCRHKR